MALQQTLGVVLPVEVLLEAVLQQDEIAVLIGLIAALFILAVLKIKLTVLRPVIYIALLSVLRLLVKQALTAGVLLLCLALLVALPIEFSNLDETYCSNNLLVGPKFQAAFKASLAICMALPLLLQVQLALSSFLSASWRL